MPVERLYNVVVVGGAGHVGLPLAIHLAKTCQVTIYDTDSNRLDALNRGIYPYRDAIGTKMLAGVRDRLRWTQRLTDCAPCRTVVIATYEVATELLESLLCQLPQTRLIVLRSTVPSGTTRAAMVCAAEEIGHRVDVAYCPERSVEDKSLEEMLILPQLVGCDSLSVFRKVRDLLSFAPSFVRVTPEEAEATKLMTNAYRFAHFALANQFYLLLLQQGLDVHRVFKAAKLGYPRMSGFPKAGFVGGPCLRKDSIMFLDGNGPDGNLLEAALRTNDGMARSLIELVNQRIPLSASTVGILGCGFKAGSDDTRWSPGKEFVEALAGIAKTVLCADPYVRDASLFGLEEVVRRSDVLFVVTPHPEYCGMTIPQPKVVIDPWGVVAPRPKEAIRRNLNSEVPVAEGIGRRSRPLPLSDGA